MSLQGDGDHNGSGQHPGRGCNGSQLELIPGCHVQAAQHILPDTIPWLQPGLHGGCRGVCGDHNPCAGKQAHGRCEWRWVLLGSAIGTPGEKLSRLSDSTVSA